MAKLRVGVIGAGSWTVSSHLPNLARRRDAGEIELAVVNRRNPQVLERIRAEFAGVQRSYIPLHSVLRVDEVEKQGTSKISAIEGNVAQFPLPVYAPGSDSSRGK